MTTQEELLKKIADSELEQKSARNRMSMLNKELMNAESHLIFCNLTTERLVEELRMLRAKTIDRTPDLREQDIEEFRAVLPALLKKIK